MLTQKRLKELLNYNPDTGVFTRLVKIKQCNIGDIAGSNNGRGYLLIRVDRKQYLAHRLAWFYIYGIWPNNQIDHIDGIRVNNYINNLRDVNRTINMENQKYAHKNNKSTGLMGVSKLPSGRFQAAIQINKKINYLGSFDTENSAYLAYLKAKRKYHSGCTI